MPIVNFDYNQLINGNKDHRIGKWTVKLSAVIEETARDIEKDYDLTSLLYNMVPSESAFESLAIEDSYGYMKATYAGNKAESDKTSLVGKKFFEHIPYTMNVQFTRQMLDDAQYALKPDHGMKGKQIPESYYRTREAIAQLGYIKGEEEYLDFAGGRTPLTTYDGKPLFSKEHEYGVKDGHAYGRQSNLFYVIKENASSGDIAEYVAQASIHIRQMKDSNGRPQRFHADTLLMPGGATTAKYEQRTRIALGSDFFPGMANNEMNPQSGLWNFKVLPEWELETDNGFEMIVMSQDAKENMMSMFYDRTPLDISVEYDKKHWVYDWNAYSRFSIGHANYKHVAKIKVFDKDPGDEVTSKMTQL